MAKQSAKENIAKGMAVGACMLIPGVSGGTMAIILGFYDSLIAAVSSFLGDPKKNARILATYGLGGILGILLFSRAILFVTNAFSMPMRYLFLGAVLGSLPMLFGRAGVKAPSRRVILYPALGVLCVLLVGLLPEDLISYRHGAGIGGFLLLLLAGVVISVALILPGISVSYMLLVLGIYAPTLTAIKNLQFSFLLVLGLGLFFGILLTARLLELALTRHAEATYLVILGFVLGTLKDVYPGLPSGFAVPVCLFAFAAGFLSIFFLSRFSD